MATATSSSSSSWARLPARLAKRLPATTSDTPPELAYLISVVRAHNPDVDLGLVEKAYRTAARAHEGQRRHNGAPYITHPLAVAAILASLGMPPTVLAAALLHDTVEDTDYELDELRGDFGDEIATLVDAVTKIDKATAGQAAKAETVRKMVVAMARDIRVLVMKLADRLHNARTYQHVPKEASRKRQARETLDIFVPLANRLGMGTIKRELEDLCFATLHPKVNEEVTRLVAERAEAYSGQLDQMITEIEHELADADINATVISRRKHNYSIYQNVAVRGRELDDFGDVSLIQIITEDVEDCYLALGAIHGRWNPLPNMFREYIAAPKFNMYQSLHTTVLGIEAKPVAIQIRTNSMHQRAEEGIAAYWRHAGLQAGTQVPIRPRSGSDLSWIRQLVDWQRETYDSSEFLESLRLEMEADEVFLLTPGGDIVTLPAGCTPVDFAYAIHTDVGHRAVGVRVNNRLVPLESVLENGDVVEILTAKVGGAGPSRGWLSFAKTARARNKINQWFAEQQRKTNADPKAAAEAADADLPHTAPPHLARRHPPPPPVVGDGVGQSRIKLARCCMPVPGDAIVAFQTRNGALSVHRIDCANVGQLSDQHEPITVDWADQQETRGGVYLVEIELEALDRKGLVADVSRAIARQGANIMSGEISAGTDMITTGRFGVELSDPTSLHRVIKAIRDVTGVYEARRHGAPSPNPDGLLVSSPE